MHRTPSTGDIQRLVIDLCRATVMLRIADSRGVLSEGGESGRLADSIDDWINACEPQIAPILEETARGEARALPDNVVDFAAARRRRGGLTPTRPRAGSGGLAPELPDKSADAQCWSDLRQRLSAIASRLQEG